MQPQQRIVGAPMPMTASGGAYPAANIARPGVMPMQAGLHNMQQGQPLGAPARIVQGQPGLASPQPTAVRPAPARIVSSQPTQPAYMAAGQTSITSSINRPAALRAGPARVSAPPSTTAARPHVAAGPGFTQAAYESKHADDDPQLQNLKELRKMSGLKNVPVTEGLRMLKEGAIDGKLTRQQFLDAYMNVLHTYGVQPPSEDIRNAVFDLFDRDDNAIVDMMELICGISLLCAGSEDDKIQAVFQVFDENGDGFISMDEMFKFLTSVFRVVLTPNVISVMNSMGVTVNSAEDLASVTALECFKTADLNHDKKLSMLEFKNWFYAPRNDPSFLFSPVRKLLQ